MATPGFSELSRRQDHIWAQWLALTAQLPAQLSRDVQAEAQVSLPDFDVLGQLTVRPDARARVAELARSLGWERSRLSHHVTRMAERGLVRREECPNDGRGAFVVLTTEGRGALERAAPVHARAVRRLLFDVLTRDDVESFATVIDKVLTRLDLEARSSSVQAGSASSP